MRQDAFTLVSPEEGVLNTVVSEYILSKEIKTFLILWVYRDNSKLRRN
jgi:hypothetical protein